METNNHFTSFAGFNLIASGDLKTVLTKTKEHMDTKGQEQVLIFDDDTGKQVDFNMHGTIGEIMAIAQPDLSKKGPGRPKLGVVSGEISLLPRHWEWLNRQPIKASGTIRRLVEAAMKNESGGNNSKLRIEAIGKFIWSIAGNLAGFEEASRALYSKNMDKFYGLISTWPEDLRTHIKWMAQTIADSGL
jgi:uncharacterized protein